MIDPGLTKIAQWIHDVLIPNVHAFFSEMFKTNIFQTMTQDELEIGAIKLALEALLLALLVSFGKKITKKKKYKQYKKHNNKTFTYKKWSPTGWLWDEEKGVWVPPDYINEESQRRWKWDEEKQIWIDLEKDKT